MNIKQILNKKIGARYLLWVSIIMFMIFLIPTIRFWESSNFWFVFSWGCCSAYVGVILTVYIFKNDWKKY